MAGNLSFQTLLFAAATAWLPGVAGADSGDPTSGDLVLFPGSGLRPLETESTATAADAIGWNIPGRHFRSGDGWWALSCAGSCALVPQRLAVRPGTHPDYDGPPLPSQFLSWRPIGAAAASPAEPPAQVMMYFKPLRAAAGMALKEGPLTTWWHGAVLPGDETPAADEMKTVIELGAAGQAVLMPRLALPKRRELGAAGSTPEASSAGEANDQTLVFELRASGKRQKLGTYQWDIEGAHPLASRDYLLWAGDLDGDGKVDLLMSYAGRGWDTVLYLSSRASADELVGEAGRFRFWSPDDPGC